MTDQPLPGPQVGDPAIDFTLESTGGTSVTLSNYFGAYRVLLIFYPKDFTSGWTNQLSAVRRAIDSYRDLDTIPFGISGDDLDSHERFKVHLKLPFDLLVDEGLTLAREYGALKPVPGQPGVYGESINRTVFIVGKDGTIIYRANGIPSTDDLLNTIRHAGDE
jgi:peroxiredoxin Q/BCP